MKNLKPLFVPLRAVVAVAAIALAVFAFTGCPMPNGDNNGGPTFTLTFNANSATHGTVPPPQTAQGGTAITLPGPGTLGRDGHTFGGWNTSPTGAGASHAANSPFTLSANTTLYAVWNQPISITVTGIPSQYINTWGNISLARPGTWNWVAYSNGVSIAGPSATIALLDDSTGEPFATPGTYDVRLEMGSSEYLIPSRLITSGANTIPFSSFTRLEEISINITGIPSQYVNRDVEIILMRPGTMDRVAGDDRWAGSPSVTFTMRAIPGTYDIFLRFWGDGNVYSISSRNINAGANNIPFASFARVDPITITVTGIPNRYIDGYGTVLLNTPGLVDWLADSWARIDGSSATFPLFVFPGVYDVVLFFEDYEGWGLSLYSVPSRTITDGNNAIPFSAFAPVESIAITVTGIPGQYMGNYMDIALRSGALGVAYRGTVVRGSSATMSFLWDENTDWVFNTPGTYELSLYFRDHNQNLVGRYQISSRNITAGDNSIPLSAFTPVESIAITITGIPPVHHQGEWGEVVLFQLGTGNEVARSSMWVGGSSVTVTMWYITPGAYDVRLRLRDGNTGHWMEYRVPSRNLVGGANSIPFSDFEPMSMSITITGIPHQYHYQGGDLSLTCPWSLEQRASAWLSIEGSSVTAILWDNHGGIFNTPGTYNILLELTDGNTGRWMLYQARYWDLVEGANTIPFSDFEPPPPEPVPVTLTVTGIPYQYHGGEISFSHPGTGDWFAWHEVWIDGSSATFPLLVLPRVYDIRLMLRDINWSWWEYRVFSMYLAEGNNEIPFSDFEPMSMRSITVTGIPSQYHYQTGQIDLAYPGTENWFYSTSASVSSSATFNLNANPGTYDVRLWLTDGNTGHSYRILSRNLAGGANTIPFSEFVYIVVTVTGIPSQYHQYGEISLSHPGTGNWFGGSVLIKGSSATFNQDTNPGTYDVRLRLLDGNTGRWMEYRLLSRNLAWGTNTIPFSDFEPRYMVITVTGIPSHNVLHGQISLAYPGTGDWFYSTSASVNSSATFILNANPGTYDVRLVLQVHDHNNLRWMEYRLFSRHLTWGATSIPFSEFEPMYIIIAVTGIPSQYEQWGRISLSYPGTEDEVIGYTAWVEGSATFNLNANPGTYDVRLRLFAGTGHWMWMEYRMLSRNLVWGVNTIPLSDFEPMSDGFSANLEPLERTLPGGSRSPR